MGSEAVWHRKSTTGLGTGALGSMPSPAPSWLHDIGQAGHLRFLDLFHTRQKTFQPQDARVFRIRQGSLESISWGSEGSRIWQLEGARERHLSLSHFTLLYGVGQEQTPTRNQPRDPTVSKEPGDSSVGPGRHSSSQGSSQPSTM